MGYTDMSKAPKDKHILLRIEGQWIEGYWDRDGNDYWHVAHLPIHGCGCCAESNDHPTAWSYLPD